MVPSTLPAKGQERKLLDAALALPPEFSWPELSHGVTPQEGLGDVIQWQAQEEKRLAFGGHIAVSAPWARTA